MRAELFMYFCEELHRDSEWRFVDSKSALNSPVVYNTDRSKAVVLVLFLFCVALRFVLRGAFHVETCPALCSRVFQSCLQFDHLAWGRESWSMCFSCICLFILFEPRHEKMCLRESPTRQDTNWPAQLQRPARFLKCWIYKPEVSFCLGSEQQRRWSDCADAQAGLRLCCSHMA